MFLRGRVSWQVLSLAPALLGLACCIELSENCASLDNVALFVSLGTNRTGHRVVNARLEQPAVGEIWKLDTKLEFSKCETERSPRKVITIKLTGLPLLGNEDPQVLSFNPYPLGSRGQNPSECDCSSQRLQSASLVSRNDENNEIERISQGRQIKHERIVTQQPTMRPTGPRISKQLASKYTQVAGVGYVRVEKQPKTWLEARAQCAAENATLALPRDLQTAKALMKLFDFKVQGTYNSNMVWLGASDIETEGQWVIFDGTPLHKASSIKWGAGEPTHKKEENCLLFHKVQFVAADGDCDRIQPFACSIPF